MKILSAVVVSIFAVSCSGTAQTAKSRDVKDAKEDTATKEYVDIEVRGMTPAMLEGTWVLESGVPTVKRKIEELRAAQQDVKASQPNDAPSAPRITPEQKDNLHIPEKPSISFYGESKTFSGFTGCNKYAGRYTVEGKKLTLKNAAPSTKMECLGDYDENSFLQQLQKVTGYRANKNGLELLHGDDVVLVFQKKS